MRERNVPVLMVLSENDKLVDTDISYEMANLLGAKGGSYSTYDHNTCVIQTMRTNKDHPWILVLPKGGHYSFKNIPKVVNEAISEFARSLA